MASVRVTITLQEEETKKLKEYSEETGVPYSRVISKALKEYLEKKTK